MLFAEYLLLELARARLFQQPLGDALSAADKIIKLNRVLIGIVT
jgi:hypothetical protein